MTARFTTDSNGTRWKSLPEAQAGMLAVLVSEGEVHSNDRIGLTKATANKRTARALVDLGVATWTRAELGQRWKIIERRRPLTRKGEENPVPKVKLAITAEVEVR